MTSLTLSPTQQKRVALLYALKLSILAAFPAALLSVLACAAILTFVTGYSWPFAGLSVIGPCIGSTTGVAISMYRSYRNLLNLDYMGTSVVDRADYITLSLPYHLAFKLCLDSLSEFGNQRIILEDRAQGRIEAALLPEPIWKDPLNSCLRISFRLGSDEEGITKVEFLSKAALPTVRFDFGQNEKNVNQIRTFLQKSSSPHKTMK